MELNPSAARSLEEGLEETLTVHKLRVPDQLRRTLFCTNVIESAFPIGLPQRPTPAVRRSDRTLGWVAAAGCRTAVPQGHRPSSHSAVAPFAGHYCL